MRGCTLGFMTNIIDFLFKPRQLSQVGPLPPAMKSFVLSIHNSTFLRFYLVISVSLRLRNCADDMAEILCFLYIAKISSSDLLEEVAVASGMMVTS